MKKSIVIFCILVILVSFGACKSGTAAEEPTAPQNGALCLRIVDGAGTKQLVLAGEKSGDVYTADTSELTVYSGGEPAASSDLKDGMLLSVDAGYELLETWPAQITKAVVRVQSEQGAQADHGDLCGVYLQVLEDLWANDSGLNGDITYISVDLKKAPGNLTDGEKAAITWILSGRLHAQGLQFSFEELKENGYVDESFPAWEDGVLFSITEAENGKNTANRITFNAQKWSSGLGAIFFTDCTAKRGKGVQWKPYQIGGFAIA